MVVGTVYLLGRCMEGYWDGVMLWCPPQPWLGRRPQPTLAADLAGIDVPAVAGIKLSAVAEVYSSAVDDEGAP